MDKEIEDIRKLDYIIKEEHDQNTFRDEFDDFINHSISDDEQLDCLDDEELIEIEGAIDNIVDKIDQNIYHNVKNLNFSANLNLVKRFLDLEEIKIINLCKDAKLKRLLILNRAKHVQLQNIRYRLYELLKECKISLKTLEEEIQKSTNFGGPLAKSITPKLGYPYFKTKDFYSCGPNADTIRKQKNKEICVDYLPQLSRWTIEDQVILKRAITFNYTTYRIEKYELSLKTLEATKKTTTDPAAVKDLEKVISDVNEKLNDLKKPNDKEPPPLGSNVEINWLNISKCDFESRHSPEACKAFWNIYLHPSINKGSWTDEENEKIVALAKRYNFQNWEQIAENLQNNRSGFAVCVHYYTSLSERIIKDKFHPEEDRLLVDVVNSCRIGNYIPWSKVCHYFQNRSRAQLYHRYRYYLEYPSLKKGPFSQSEDVLLALLVRKFGKDFRRCATLMPHRAPTQLAHRYINYLSFEKISLGCWTLEDDQIIIQHVRKCGAKDWSSLFSLLTTRNRSHIRQRYIYLKNWLVRHPGKRLEDLPRKSGYNKSVNKYAVKSAIEYFAASKELPTFYEINEYLRGFGQKSILLRHQIVTYNPPKANIDKELMDYFQSTCKIKSSKIISGTELNHIVDVVRALMMILDVEFIVPDNDSLNRNPNLDVLDVEILTLLFSDVHLQNIPIEDNKAIIPSTSHKKNYTPIVRTIDVDGCWKQVFKCYQPDVISYLPPNINTLVGIRSLLLIHQSYKSKRLQNPMPTSSLQTIVIKSEEIDVDDEQNFIISDQERFYTRFNAIFTWPALMSIMKPKETLFVNKTTKKETPTPAEYPKVGRPKKNLIKIELMNKARMKKKEIEQQNRTTPVDSCGETSVVSINIEPTVHSQSSAAIKRCNDFKVINTYPKKIKTETVSCDSEITDLREDIDKLDSALNKEFNKEL